MNPILDRLLPVTYKMNIRITQKTAKELQECADTLNISRIAVIEKGISLVKAEIKNRE